MRPMRLATGADSALLRRLRLARSVRPTCTSAMSAASEPPEGPKPKVLVVTGPTAVGKTAVSLALAERLNGEIISADSVQVYRGLDIGSDKIPVAARRGIPHHLIDVFDPVNDFSAGEFFHAARAATADILARGRTPIVVGGTGFYLRWYLLGKPSTPSSSKESEAAAAAALDAAWAAAADAAGRPLTDAELWAAGVGVVAALGDAESAKRLATETNNYYRLTRVVDILMQSPGKTLAELNLDEAAPLEYDFRCFFLARPRTALYRRIDARVEEMVAGGLLPETADRLEAAGLRPNTNCATRSIGYRQALEFLERKAEERRRGGAAAPVTDAEVVALAKDIMTASRRLCHRQMSWFRDDPLFQWVDAAAGEDAAVDIILDGWAAEAHQGGAGPQFNGGRLTKEEQGEMKRYVSRLERLTPGSGALTAAVVQAEEALAAVVDAVADGDSPTERAPAGEEPQAKRSRAEGE